MAHRTDLAWQKTSGRSFQIAGVNYGSEYRNIFTGQSIRKGHGMTGLDWFIFDGDDKITGRAHSLTVAKWDAER
jgi:hypothetical protein